MHRAGCNDKKFIKKVNRIYERWGLEFKEPAEYRYIFRPVELGKLIDIAIKMVDNFHARVEWGEAGPAGPIGDVPKVQYFGPDDPDKKGRFFLEY